MAHATHDAVTPKTRPFVSVLVVSAAAFLASLDLFIVIIAFPAVQSSFPDTGFATISWILNAYTVVYAAFLNPAGRLADRYGHRRLFLWGLAVFTLGSAACGLSGSFVALVAARVVQAFGAAMLTPSSLALLLASVTQERRPAAVSIWSAVGAAAAALGPPVGGLLVQFSWRWVFLVNVPIAVVAMAIGPWVLRKSNTTASGVPDLLGALCLVVGVGALVWAFIDVPVEGWHSVNVLVAVAVAVLTLLLVLMRSGRHPSPALDLVALRVGALWSSCLAMLFFTVAFGAMLLGNVLFLTEVWHQPPDIAGLWLAPGPIVVVVVSLAVAGPLVGRVGLGPVAAVGAALYGIGVALWLWRIGPTADYVGAFLPGQLLTGVGVGLVLPSLSAVVGIALPQHRWGAGSAMINTSRQVGIVLGTAAITVIYQPVVDLTAVRDGWMFLVGGACAAALTAGIAAFGWRNSAGQLPR